MRYAPLVNPTLENQLGLMERYHISQALCSGGFCVNGDLGYGNETISKWAENHSNILPVFTAVPESFTPFDGAKAVRIYPKDMVFPLSKLHMADICACAAERELPILLSLSQIDIRDLIGLLPDFPDVNFILTEVYYRNYRNLLPLMNACKNLYIETSFLKTFGSLEFLCRELASRGRSGAGRLVFGTGSPYYDAGAAISMLLGAEITQAEKELIAHGNIRSLCRLEAEA